jgi:hypothetical protein
VEPHNILSGTRVTALNAIQGQEAKEVRWVCPSPKAKEKLELEIVSALAGTAQATVDIETGRNSE